MEFRPKKKIVEHALDSLVVDILLEPSEPKLNYLKTILDRLQEMGYRLKHYTKMYEKLKDDYKQDTNGWRSNIRENP